MIRKDYRNILAGKYILRCRIVHSDRMAMDCKGQNEAVQLLKITWYKYLSKI